MRFASAISDAVDAQTAADTLCQQVHSQLRRRSCDFALLFVSTLYQTDWEKVAKGIREKLETPVLIGSTGSGIIGGDRELEWVPAMSLVGAHLPGVKVAPFAVTPEEMEEAEPGGFWIDKVGTAPGTNPSFVICADSFTCQPEKLLNALNHTYPGRPIIGSLASGGQDAGEHTLFFNDSILSEGAVGVAFSGNIAMDAVVSPGCRPIGKPYVITCSEENLILELGGRQALEVLHEALFALPEEDRDLAQRGSIVVGVVIDEVGRRHFGPTDFLIRQIVGLDPNNGALAVADELKPGRTIQFHLRDADTARVELRRLMARQHEGSAGVPPAGALIFNCLSRGRAFYGNAHHDLKTIHTFNGKLPVGGFFSNGEIGPAGGTNFLHGYTASVGFFRPLRAAVPVETRSAGEATAG